jgi:antitoxin YefM
MIFATEQAFVSHVRDYMSQVVNDCDPMLVARDTGDLVFMPRDDYDSLMETVHLLGSPANARHLTESLDQANRGELTKIKLDDLWN